MGFKDSFITAVLDGKAVSIDRAVLLEEEWGKKPLIIIAQALGTGETAPLTLNFRVEISRQKSPSVMKLLPHTKRWQVAVDLKYYQQTMGSMYI